MCYAFLSGLVVLVFVLIVMNIALDNAREGLKKHIATLQGALKFYRAVDAENIAEIKELKAEIKELKGES